MAEPNRSMTGRGFTVYDEFTDTYGAEVRVQESSYAGEPRCWIFSCGEKKPPDAKAAEIAARINPPAHLNLEQAKRVRDALDAFIRENL